MKGIRYWLKETAISPFSNAIILRKLQPIYIKIIIVIDIMLPYLWIWSIFLEIIEEHQDIKGVILTYPNYYGVAWRFAKNH